MSHPERPLSRIERTEAQAHVEVDETLLRGVRREATLVAARRHLLEGEIAGARQAIEEKERQIVLAQDRIKDLDGRLERLKDQEAKLRDDQTSWSERLAG